MCNFSLVTLNKLTELRKLCNVSETHTRNDIQEKLKGLFLNGKEGEIKFERGHLMRVIQEKLLFSQALLYVN